MKSILTATFLSCLLVGALGAQTIDEKKAGLTGKGPSDLDVETQVLLNQTNRNLAALKVKLRELQDRLIVLVDEGGTVEEMDEISDEIRNVRRALLDAEQKWRDSTAGSSVDETYALWNQLGTTIEQLVMDYGSQDYVYLIPNDIGTMKVSVATSLPVPRESWTQLLELVLAQSGIGVQQQSPMLRRFYILGQDQSHIMTITNDAADLDILSSNDRICFVISPENTDVRGVYQMLQKFIKTDATTLHLIGPDIFVVARAAEVRELLKVYDFMESNRGAKEYRLIALKKGDADEMAQVLQAIFTEKGVTSSQALTSSFQRAGSGQTSGSAQRQNAQRRQSSNRRNQDIEGSGLLVMPLKQIGPAIFLMGSRTQVERAEEILFDLESQIGEAQEKTIFYYRVKHSDAEELASVLEKVYNVIISTQLEREEQNQAASQELAVVEPDNVTPVPSAYDDSQGLLFIPPKFRADEPKMQKAEVSGDSFIVDPKTGSIIMVVEPFALSRLRDLLKKLDVPKKMVRIDILLFEKRVTSNNNFGIDVFKLGDKASQARFSGLEWSGSTGILDFMLSRVTGEAFDLTYSFLLSRDDIQINSNPSVITVNNTPAKISVVEEISINTGAYERQDSDLIKDSFSREHFGVTIEVTPNVHDWNEGEDDGDPFVSYITLDTDVVFDDLGENTDDRPPVLRRKLTNHVRVADGEMVILGGLRSKRARDNVKSIPFFGEIPGVAKFFRTTQLEDRTTEMFMCLTPRIVEDPLNDVRRMRLEECKKRPGDLPDFLQCLVCARQMEKKELFAEGMKALFGRPKPKCVSHCGGEYDGWN